MILLASGAIILLSALAVAGLRMRCYRKHLLDDPCQDTFIPRSPDLAEVVEVPIENNGVTVAKLATGCGSILLQVMFRSSLLGRFSDPIVKLTAETMIDRQHMEKRFSAGLADDGVQRLLLQLRA